MSKENGLSRRKFIGRAGGTAAAAAMTTLAPAPAQAQTAADPASGYDRARVIASLGDTLIPSGPGDPGYATLEPYGITAEVMKGLAAVSDDTLSLFNREAARLYGGKAFADLGEKERADYLNSIADGDTSLAEKPTLDKLQSVYRLVRTRVFIVFYQNYPQHTIPRDERGAAILPPDDRHQITNPNKPGLVTGWDIAGWTGPMTWEEEEQRRAHFKTVRWQEKW